jgi:hypothetical protein
MDDLARLEDFAQEDAPIYAYAEITGVSASIFVMTVMIVALLTEWSTQGVAFWRSFTLAIAYGIVFGIIASTLQFLIHRGDAQRNALRSLNRLFAGDPASVPPAPPDATARLFCGLLTRNSRFCGGVLYVRAQGLYFQPHYPRVRFWQRPVTSLPPGLLIEPARSITLARAFLMPRPWWRQPFVRGILPLLVCTWESGSIAFRVPRLGIVQERLQSRIDELRAHGAV